MLSVQWPQLLQLREDIFLIQREGEIKEHAGASESRHTLFLTTLLLANFLSPWSLLRSFVAPSNLFWIHSLLSGLPSLGSYRERERVNILMFSNYTWRCGIISDSWNSSSAHSCNLTVTSLQRCRTCIASRSDDVWAGIRVCEDSKCIIALASSSTSMKRDSSFSNILLWWLHILWNSSMTLFSEELAPAAHWSRCDIRNCWLCIFSMTFVIEVASCSDRTLREGERRRDKRKEGKKTEDENKERRKRMRNN